MLSNKLLFELLVDDNDEIILSLSYMYVCLMFMVGRGDVRCGGGV